MVRTPIPTLRGTPTHRTAVELYRNHYSDAAGRCERMPCPTRAHAALVITAAGEDPGWYAGRLSPPTPGPDKRSTAQLDLGATYANHTGYRVGGRDTRHNPAGYLYERDQP